MIWHITSQNREIEVSEMQHHDLGQTNDRQRKIKTHCKAQKKKEVFTNEKKVFSQYSQKFKKISK